MTILQQSIDAPKAKIDWTKPVLWLFAACLVALIVLPLSWLAIYSVTDKAHHLTLQNFVTLFTDPDFLDPLLTTAIIAISSATICCAVAAPMGWLVSRTDMPGRQFIRALVTASFVTPPFLGAVAWELLAAPNSGLLNQLFRFVTGAEADEHLFDIYTMTGIIVVISCYKGFTCEGGAEGVGKATTSAVVMSMVLVLVVDYFLSAVLVSFGIG